MFLQVILRAIDSAVKTIGATSNELLDMIEKCPPGAETLAARIVHLLTERSAVNYFVFLCCFLKVLRIRASGFRSQPKRSKKRFGSV